MMTAMDTALRTVTVYLPSEYAATEVVGYLKGLCEVDGPHHVVPYMGRAFAVTITLPTSLSPMPQYPDEHLLSRINRVVMQFDGVASKPGGTP